MITWHKSNMRDMVGCMEFTGYAEKTSFDGTYTVADESCQIGHSNRQSAGSGDG